MADGLQLTIRGARGSMPASGFPVSRYGGRTIALDAQLGNDSWLLIDCGTGIRLLDETLPRPAGGGLEFHVLFTHYHWDHVQGLPFFHPLYDQRNRFTFYGHSWNGIGVEELVSGALRAPYFPVSLDEAAAAKEFIEVLDQPMAVGGLSITPRLLRHPQGVTAYRLDQNGRTIVVATDVEVGEAVSDAALVELASGADVLIHDAQYLPAEHETYFQGWGHSTWQLAVQTAKAAGVGRLVLISHDPDRSDDQIDAIVEAARQEFPEVEAAHEGMTIEV